LIERELTGKTFERLATGFLRHRHDLFEVRHDIRLRGRSGTVRQLDSAGYDPSGGLVVGKSKDYGKTLGIGYVDRFDGFLYVVNAVAGVLFSAKGFTGPARKRSAAVQIPIELTLVQYGTPRTPEEMLNEDRCPNHNCFSPDISWGYNTDGGAYITSGTCDFCGTVVVVCPVCGSLNGEHVSAITCENCGFEVSSEHEWWDSGDARITIVG
jgi:hypothetical protein